MNDPGSPWIQIPDDWLDDRYSAHDGYRAFQEYFALKIKPGVIREYLIGKGILLNARIEVERFSAQEHSGRLGVDATLRVSGRTRSGGVGTDSVEIYRTLDLTGRHCSFDKLGASTVNLKGFGVEYYRRVIPLLRKLGIERITTMAMTAPEESPEKYQFIGAYLWSLYGYSNDNMSGTLNQYIDYLQAERGLSLSKCEIDDILTINRMVRLAAEERHGDFTGAKFLLGKDRQDVPTRSIWWSGSHCNIYDESTTNIEMVELVDYLLGKIK